MKKHVGVLIVLARGELLMQRADDGMVAAFGGALGDREVPVQAAVRVLEQEAGLDVRADDLEFLDSYVEGDLQTQVFVMAGVDEERVYPYGGEESLYKVHRSSDFSKMKMPDLAQKYVTDYFKSHKKW